MDVDSPQDRRSRREEKGFAIYDNIFMHFIERKQF